MTLALLNGDLASPRAPRRIYTVSSAAPSVFNGLAFLRRSGLPGFGFCSDGTVMINYLMAIFFLLAPSAAGADGGVVKVFKGTGRYRSDIICTVRDSKIYKGTSVYYSDIFCTVKGDKIFKGTSPYRTDIMYTIKDGKVYEGTSVYESDVVMTIRDGIIYKGKGVYRTDILATVKDGKVYSGTSSYDSDILFTVDGNLTLEEFVAVWYSVVNIN